MTIVYIYRSLAIFGGIERIFIDKINYLADVLKHNVYIITYEQGKHPIVFPLSPNATHIDLEVLFYRQYQYGALKRFFLNKQMTKEFQRKLEYQIKAINPDIIIGATCELATLKAMANLKDRSKKIIETHAAREGVERANIKIGNFIHALGVKLQNKQMHKFIRKSDAFVALTLQDAKNWSDIKDTDIIPNILTHYPLQLPAKKRTKKAIAAGRLTEQKGYDLLIQAWKIIHEKHPDYILDIYGKGEEEQALRQQINQFQLNNTVYIHEPTNRIYEKYLESDFYIMSSRWEGFGLVLSEAMSCGIPCISFNCPYGPSDIINNNEDGLLVENGNIEKLAESICFMIENENKRIKMGEKARENIKRYLPENIMLKWENLFNRLINEKYISN